MSDHRGHEWPVYEIRVMGKLDERWSDWFGGMEIATGDSAATPITVLTGPVVDQSALRGILNRLWDLNLVVISITTSTPGVKF